MCGIVGYTGGQNAPQQILEGLKKLEYRGYDSAGIASIREGKITIKKKEGKISNLESELKNPLLPEEGWLPTESKAGVVGVSCGIGHTRWATHGKPSDENSHPHTGCDDKIALVHNGIIENYQELKEKLIASGHKFKSSTDTEVVAHVIEDEINGVEEIEDLIIAISRGAKKLKGQFALAIIHKDFPDTIIGVRYKAPLVVGVGKNEMILASDLTAIVANTSNLLNLNDNELTVITPTSYEIYDLAKVGTSRDLSPHESLENAKISRKPKHTDLKAQDTEKGEYKHFMLKEIFEQPESILKTLEINAKGEKLALDIPVETHCNASLQIADNEITQIVLTACGTASYAALFARYLFLQFLKIPVTIELGSELRYSDYPMDENTLVIGVSQSGETADTLEALRLAKQSGATTIAVTNWIGSTMAREADYVVNMNCGVEIGVAASKTYTSQLLSLVLLGKYLSGDDDLEAITELPKKIEKVLKDHEIFRKWAKQFHKAASMIYIGRGYNLATAYEGAIKNKEISYIHAEGYPAGELKHGPIALLDEQTPVVAIASKDKWYDKTVSNIEESIARSAPVVLITNEGNDSLDNLTQFIYKVPGTEDYLQPILNVIPLQLFAYYLADELGREIDKPRNLAKSVTVE